MMSGALSGAVPQEPGQLEQLNNHAQSLRDSLRQIHRRLVGIAEGILGSEPEVAGINSTHRDPNIPMPPRTRLEAMRETFGGIEVELERIFHQIERLERL